MNEYEEVLESLKKGTKIYTDTRIDNAPYDKTTTGKIVGSSDDGYDVEINKQVYNNIPTIGGTCTLNEMVKVVIPQNNESNMFILKSASGSSSGGSGTSDYEQLSNKPKVNGVTLSGNKQFNDLGMTEVTNLEIDNLFSTIFNV